MNATTAATLLPLPVVVPLTAAVLAPLVAKLSARLPLILAIAAMAATFGLLLAIATRVYAATGSVVVHFFSAERPVHGRLLGIAFAADPFGLTFALLTAVVGTLLLLSLLSEFGEFGERELGWLAALVLLLLAALIGAALTADTINFFVWFEVAALASYGLTGFLLERPIALEAAFKILVLTSMASFAVFTGAAILYDATGALNLGQLHQATVSSGLGRAGVLGLALMVSGCATKAGLVPWHGWLPDAHTPVPGGVSALFSGLMVNMGVLGLVRLALQVFGPGTGHHLLGLLSCVGIVSALLGAVMALAQDDLKRLLAWDTVSQMGILVVGFATARSVGVAGATFHLVNHGLFKTLLFLCAGSLVHSTGATTLSEMGGLARHRPFVCVAFIVGAMSIGGVPGFNGYVSLDLIHEGLKDEPGIFALALLAQVITVAALARAVWLAFFRRRSEPYEQLQPTRTGMRISLIVLGVGCVGLGVVPYLLLDRVVAPATSTLLHGGQYAAAVLAGGGPMPAGAVDFSYGKLDGLGLAALEIVLGLVLAAVYLRIREPAPVRWLRALHTGSVNDYATYAAAGIAVTSFVLLAG